MKKRSLFVILSDAAEDGTVLEGKKKYNKQRAVTNSIVDTTSAACVRNE